eukprot:gene32489-63719_t
MVRPIDRWGVRQAKGQCAVVTIEQPLLDRVRSADVVEPAWAADAERRGHALLTEEW